MDLPVEKIVTANHSTLVERLVATNLMQLHQSSSGDTLKMKLSEEIGDGNLNIVYRVTMGPDNPRSPSKEDVSVIVKYAPPFIKVHFIPLTVAPSGGSIYNFCPCTIRRWKVLGPSFPLTQERLEVEYSALHTYHRLSPGCVPIPLLFDKKENSIIMEDLKGWSILRSELIEGSVDLEAIKSLMISVATVHNLSSKPVCTDEEHSKLRDTFRNKEMVSVTEQYIFVKPFTDNDPTNKHDPLLNKEVEKLRHESTKCCQRAEEMRKVFVECQDCFCHGDLHTGSVMIGDGCSKMFDIEFALIGPATFDFGMFLANLMFVLIRHHIQNNTSAVRRIKDAINTALQSYIQVFTIKDENIFTINTCGFIGCELIRRVIGAAHVNDLSTLPEGELIALKLGKIFLLSDKDHCSLYEIVEKAFKDTGL